MADILRIDTPRDVNVIGVGPISLRLDLPAPYDYNRVYGQIFLHSFDYQVKPVIIGLRMALAGRQLTITDPTNLDSWALTVPGGAADALRLKDTDVGFDIDMPYDASSRRLEILMTVTANAGATGFWLFIRPRLFVAQVVRGTMFDPPAVIKMAGLDGSVSGEVNFSAVRETAK